MAGLAPAIHALVARKAPGAFERLSARSASAPTGAATLADIGAVADGAYTQRRRARFGARARVGATSAASRIS
jgi:hypothetical protein